MFHEVQKMVSGLAPQEIILEEGDKRFAICTECRGTCGKIFQSVGVPVPPTIRRPEGA